MANKALVGEKVGMTQMWDDTTRSCPSPCSRVRRCRGRSRSRHPSATATARCRSPTARSGQEAHQPEAGHFTKHEVAPACASSKLRLADVTGYEIGQEIGVDSFAAGDRIDVTAVSKGKGFAGVMKRHNFAGQKASHGTHRVHRAPGSIGACATPARVFKGTRMAGRMGGEKVTTMNLTVVEANAEQDVLLIKGAVPGPKGGLVIVRNAVKLTPVGGES
jgi:large subunit ribosomal protein L3